MTEVDDNEFCFTWKIKNFPFCCKDSELLSPKFEDDGLKEGKWQLQFCSLPCLDGEELTEGFLSRRCGVEKVQVSYKIEIIYSSGRILEIIESKNEFFYCNWDSNFLIDRKEINSDCWIGDALTVRCHIKNTDSKQQTQRGRCEALTKIGVDRHSFELVFFKRKIFEKREIFHHKDITFSVEMSKPESDGVDNLTIKIDRSGMPKVTQFLLCEITLLGTDKMDDISIRNSHYFKSDKDKEVWEFLPFVNQYKLRSYCFDSDASILRFKFSVSNGTTSNKISTIQSNGIESNPLSKACCKSCNNCSTLKKDFRELLVSKKHADVELRAGSLMLPAHKYILIARSPVFAAMFDHDMIESQTGIVDVPEGDEKSLNAFLEYLYTGTVDKMDYDCAKNLLLISNKYQVLSLREKCTSLIIDSITVENVCEVFTIADMITDDKLKNSAFDYMSYHAEEVMQSTEWSRWIKNNSSLSIEILSNIVLNLKKSLKKFQSGINE